MGTFKDRENYLKGLCEAHATVAHGQPVSEGSPQLRQSFFRMNNEDELMAGTRNYIHYPCVVNMQLSARMTDKDNALADMRWVWDNEWIFLQHVENPDTEETTSDSTQDAYDETFAVMEDFIKAMKDDWETNEKCGAFDQLNFNQFTATPVGPTAAHEYGWALSFTNEQKATRITE